MKTKAPRKIKKAKGWTATQKRQLKEQMIKRWGLNKDWAKDHLVIL